MAVEWRKKLDAVAAVAMTIASCLLIAKLVWPSGPAGPPEPALPSDPIPIDGAASKGNAQAPVAIIEFSDFQCPFCAAFAIRVLPDLEREFIETGKVRLILRHLPLTAIHPVARTAAIAATCAGDQGRFWDLHDGLFRIGRALQPDVVEALARGLSGLDVDAYGECVEARGPAAVAADLELAAALGVRSTPTFFVGVSNGASGVRLTQRVSGAAALDVFRDAIAAALRESRSGQP